MALKHARTGFWGLRNEKVNTRVAGHIDSGSAHCHNKEMDPCHNPGTYFTLSCDHTLMVGMYSGLFHWILL